MIIMSYLKKTASAFILTAGLACTLLAAAEAPANVECQDGVCRLKPPAAAAADTDSREKEPAATAASDSREKEPAAAAQNLASSINKDGYFKGIRLAGKVKVVEYGADIKVQVVSGFPDLKVKVVENFPDRIGEWKFVEYGEDFTVQFVNSFADIRIKYVNSFPGVE